MHFSATTALLLSALSLSTLTSAGGCNPLKGEVVCGKVINNSKHGGKWADFDGGPHFCHVYNWNDGKGSTGWSEKRGVPCTQHDLPAGKTKGGIAQLTDVDGVTFHDRRWRIIWESGESHDFAAGVWAKFSNGETLTCRDNVQVPECKVKCELNIKKPKDSCVGADP